MAAGFGQIAVFKVLAKFKRESPIVLLMGVIILLSMILLVVVGVLQVVDDHKTGKSMGFRSIC